MDLEYVKLRSEAAWTDRQRWHSLLDDVYKYVVPWRRRMVDGSVGGLDHLFDSTAPTSAIRWAGRLQGDMFPPDRKFYDLQSGPLITKEEDIARTNAQLQGVGNLAFAMQKASNFNTASHEMALDLLAGTAAVLILEGRRKSVIGFAPVPIDEIALDEGAFGEVEGIFWKRRFKARHLPALLPGVAIPDPYRRYVTEAPDTPVELRQDTLWHAERDMWCVLKWFPESAVPLDVRWTRKKRWLTPRFFKLPGEVMGRGPAQLALPNAKTLNKTMEFVLKAAALALFGVYLWRDDNVFKPETAMMKPGALWKVASTGGVMGQPIVPLQTAREFDVSNIILADQRAQTRAVLFDVDMPDQGASVRSPTEILERLKRSYRDHAGAVGRLTSEIVVPLAEAIIDIAEEQHILPTKLDIDQLFHELVVTSPLARAQVLEDAQRVVEGVQLAATVAGNPQAVPMFADVEALIPQMLRWLGWSERHILTPDNRKKFGQMIGTMMQQQQQAAAPAPAPPPAPALRAVA